METVLVTGAGGYVGSTLAARLLEAGYRVVGLDRYYFGLDLIRDLLDNPDFQPVVFDNREVTEDNLEGVSAICDLAALSNDPAGELDPELTMSINGHARVRLAELAKKVGVKRYVLASSCSVYGAAESTSLTEASEPKPITTYAKANLAAEQGVLPLDSGDFTVTVLRQATVFGLSRRMRFDLVLNLMTLNAVQRGKIYVTGGGHQWRPLVHARDTADAFVHVLGCDPAVVGEEVFNVGHTNVQVLNLAYVVRESIPFPVEMEVVPDDPDERNYNVSFDKLRQRTGYEASTTLAEGVREVYEALKTGRVTDAPHTYTVAWYRQILEAKRLLDQVTWRGRLLD